MPNVEELAKCFFALQRGKDTGECVMKRVANDGVQFLGYKFHSQT